MMLKRCPSLPTEKIREVLQDAALLEVSGLEPPTIVRLFTELKSAGLITEVPINGSEAKRELIKLLRGA
jgi:hypothetical protein